MKLEAVIFDMDGVIIDSELHWDRMQSSVLPSLVGSWTAEDQIRTVGLSREKVFELLVGDYGLKISLKEFNSIYDDLAIKVYQTFSELHDGAISLMKELTSSNVKIGLASSSPRQWIDMVVNRFELGSLIQSISSSDDVGGRVKPFPDIYNLARSRLRVAPVSCIAIEDSEKGATAAKSASLICIGLRNGINEKQDLSMTDLVVSSLTELSYPRLSGLLQ